MAADSQFIPNNIPPPPPKRKINLPGSLKKISVEIARQRAKQAAEYYHKTVLATTPPESKDGTAAVNGTVKMSDPLRVGVTPASEDSFYRAKLRAGFIDLRNSYNEKSGRFGQHRPRTYTGGTDKSSTSRTRNKTIDQQHTGSHPDGAATNAASSHFSPRPQTSPSRKPHDKHNLYRSNSSLDIDHVEFLESGNIPLMHREYGSANSLDIMSTSGDSFFAMLQDYRNENFDQRAPAPPQMQQLLRGKLEYGTPISAAAGPGPVAAFTPKSAPHNFPPGYLNINTTNKTADGELASPSVFPSTPDEGSVSPRQKSKHTQKQKEKKARAKTVATETTAGLFRKLRGTKSEPSDSVSKSADSTGETDSRLDDRLRRKAFIHYDCQSIGALLGDTTKKTNSAGVQKNTTTGASAASSARNFSNSDSLEDLRKDDAGDDGDGKSNDMVLSCSFFRNELGGEEERIVSLTRHTAQKRMQQIMRSKHLDVQTMIRRPLCCGVSILDTSPSPLGHSIPTLIRYCGHIVEHVDHGALYYRNYFKDFDHQNYFGLDEATGPVAISVKREKIDEHESVNGRSDNGSAGLFQYRIIVRTSELSTLRGCILEDSIPSSSRLSSSRGLPPKDILEYACPDIPLPCLRLATAGPKTAEQLMKLDEQRINNTYKVGIMYCKAGQSTEEQMYNNEHAGPAFDEFLDMIGQRIRLKGFEKYRGGLDCKTDSTGTHSLYASLHEYQIMFHVSTMLPFTPNNKQQLLRKRHIGNDIVTIVFQEPGALPFTPKTVRSHFQHVFIIVKVHNPNTDNTYYSIAVSRSKDVPAFGPAIPEGAMFPKSREFVDMLLTKAINAENAAHKSEKFTAMAVRTRQEYLKDLATNYATATTLESGSKLSKFSLGSGRKKERGKSRAFPDVYAKGAVVWNVQVDDFGQSSQIDCHLGIGTEMLVVVEDDSKEVVFAVPCRSVIGYTVLTNYMRLYYYHGECIVIYTNPDTEDITEIISRLSTVSQACETQEMTLRRNGLGQLGFHVHYEGIVSEVEPYGFAWQAGLRQGSRLVEICKVATATLSHDQMIDLLRTSVTVKVIVIPPLEDGRPRRGIEDLRSSQHSLNSHNTSHSSGEHISLDDEYSNASSHGTIGRGHQARATPRTDTKMSHPRTVGIHPNYSGSRAVNINLEERFDHMLEQPSHEGAHHSRQSSGRGSADGHPLEGQMSRASEGYGSGSRQGSEDRHSRHSSHDSSDNSEGKLWLSRSNQHPASRDLHVGSYHGSTGQWFDHSSGDKSRGHQTSHSAFSPVVRNRDLNAHLTVSTNDRRSQASKLSPTTHHSDHGQSGFHDEPSTSSSNISDLSHSSNSSHLSVSGAQHKHNSTDDHHNQRASSLSPSGRRKQEAFTTQHRQYLDVSPLNSANTSPQANKKIISGTSEESLTARNLRHTTRSTPGKAESQHSTFHDDLMRLINPDISEADLARFQKEKSRKKLHASAPRLQRTFSDESLYSGNLKTERAAYLDGIGSDVIFTTAIPAQVVNTTPPSSASSDYLNRDDKLSLRVKVTPPENKGDHHSERHRSKKKPILPLPDQQSNLEWSSLVDAAQSFEDMKQSSGALSNSDQSDHGDSKTRSTKSSKKSDARHTVTAQERLGLAQRNSNSNSWQNSGSSENQHIQDLEAKCRQLQQEVEKERTERLSLESEVHRLRQENLRLQEESHTAAAQLRKFTEWFFNTIDKQ